MLKKTLLITAAIGATLLAAAAWLPAVAQPGSGASAVRATTTKPAAVDSTQRGSGITVDDSRNPKNQLDRHQAKGDKHTDRQADRQREEHSGRESKKDQRRSHD